MSRVRLGARTGSATASSADRKAWLLAMLDLDPADDSVAYKWERVTPADHDYMPATQRLMHVLADRTAWQAAIAEARRRAEDRASQQPAAGRAA